MAKPIASFAALLVMIAILCWQGCTRPEPPVNSTDTQAHISAKYTGGYTQMLK